MLKPLSTYRLEALWGLVAGSQVLVDLYRALGDSKQRDRALRLGTYGIEQLQRSRRYSLPDLRARVEALKAGAAGDEEIERRAWRHGLQAGFELGFLVSIGQGVTDQPGLQGALGQVQRTLGAGVLGLGTAFPDEEAARLAGEALKQAEAQAQVAMAAQFEGGAEDLSPAEVDALLGGAMPVIRESIWRAVLTVKPEWGSLPASADPAAE